jgi:integrase/recombinase XerD
MSQTALVHEIEVPVIVIFVRHRQKCRWRKDKRYRNCGCQKHLRWSHAGQQHRQSAHATTWEDAEAARDRLERGGPAAWSETEGAASEVEVSGPKTIQQCADSFVAEKESGEADHSYVRKFRSELGMMAHWLAARGIVKPKALESRDLLIEWRNTWKSHWVSSNTRIKVQERLRAFLRYLFDAGHISKVPKLSTIKCEEPPTFPLTPEQYQRLLGAIPATFKSRQQQARMHALAGLQRYAGLAIEDASTLRRTQLVYDSVAKDYKVQRGRAKTGVPISVPLPRDVSRELLALPPIGGSTEYFFWNGRSSAESIAKFYEAMYRRLRVVAKLTEIMAPDGHTYKFRSHMLRDTMAIELFQNHVPLPTVSVLLGHLSQRTTERAYRPWIPELQADAENAVRRARAPSPHVFGVDGL